MAHCLPAPEESFLSFEGVCQELGPQFLVFSCLLAGLLQFGIVWCPLTFRYSKIGGVPAAITGVSVFVSDSLAVRTDHILGTFAVCSSVTTVITTITI